MEDEEEPPLVQLSLNDIPSLSNLKKPSTSNPSALPAAPTKKKEFVLESEEMPEVKVKKVSKKKPASSTKKKEKDEEGEIGEMATEKKKKKKKASVQVGD